MLDRIDKFADFLLQLDALKGVERRSYVNGGVRLENSAEHSWHLAMACWSFAEMLDEDYDIELLIKLALVHDIGEIDAGDTFLYSNSRSDAHIEERKCIARIANNEGNSIDDLQELWEEQETGQSKETRLLKVIDRMLPFLLNVASKGKAWIENDVSVDQVLKMNGFIEQENPEIYAWFLRQIELAVEQGWLKSS